MAAIVLVVAFIGGVPLVPMVGATVMSTAAALSFVVSSQRRIDRFTAFLDITGHRDRLSYQTYQGFLAIADGGLTGSGVGAGNSKLGYLPLAHSDFIFAVVADELGFVGTLAVLGGFALLVWFGIQAALSSPDRFGMLLAGGIAAWFGVQAIVNTGGVSGLLPVTGLTLPFFSAGGSSLFVSMTAAGLLLNVARRGQDRTGCSGRCARCDERAMRRCSCAGVPGRMSVFAVITGGGTAGHVLPALAIAEELEDARPSAPSRCTTSAPSGASRPGCCPRRRTRTRSSTSSACNGASSRRNLAFLPKLLPRARARPDGCCARCGRGSSCRSAATPACLPCWRRGGSRVPVVVVSFDRRPGRASTLTARFAAASAVAFEGSPLPRAVVTGAPVRRAIRDVDRASGRRGRAASPSAAARPLPRRGRPAVRTGPARSTTAIVALRGRARRRRRPGDPPRRRRALRGGPRRRVDDPGGLRHRVVGFEPRMDLRLRRRRRARRPRRRVDRRRGRRHRHAVDPRAVVRCGRGPPDRQRPLARRSGRGGAPSREHSCDRLGRRDRGAARRPDAVATLARNAYAAGAVHRRGALGALVEGVALPDRARPASSLDRIVTPRPVPPLDLSQPRRLHVVGVGGPGMSAIAIVLAEMGHSVSGSDIREQPVLDRLRAAGVTVHVGHRPLVRRGLRRRDVVDGDAGEQHRAAPRRSSSGSRRCAGRACWRRSAPGPVRSPSPARTARRRPRRC